MKRPSHTGAAISLAVWLMCTAPPAPAQEAPEYRLKAAVLYNFTLFTEWPAGMGSTLNLCICGTDPFGAEIDTLQGKPVGNRLLGVQRVPLGGSLDGCQVVFIATSAISALPAVLEELRGRAALTVADSPDAARRGVALNMTVMQNKVVFEANLSAARSANLNLSSKLLRLATQVIQ